MRLEPLETGRRADSAMGASPSGRDGTQASRVDTRIRSLPPRDIGSQWQREHELAASRAISIHEITIHQSGQRPADMEAQPQRGDIARPLRSSVVGEKDPLAESSGIAEPSSETIRTPKSPSLSVCTRIRRVRSGGPSGRELRRSEASHIGSPIPGWRQRQAAAVRPR